MKAYLQRKIAFARSLAQAGSNAEYGDVCVVLSAILSGCSSVRWPGRGIDRSRFTEMLIRYSKPEHGADLVSIPILLNDGLIDLASTRYSAPGESCRVFAGEEIDLPMSEARNRFPAVDDQKLKDRTYAALIYSWIRCGYAHEYHLAGDTSHVPATRRSANVSYVLRGEAGKKDKRIMTFHLDYLFSLAEHHVSILPGSPESVPATWWIQKSN